MWIWLMYHLANRSQLTQVDDASSESKPIKIGVPQGVNVNDLPDSIRSGEVYMYADDTSIYTIDNTTDAVAIALQVILDQLQPWCQKNRLIFHEGKCDAVFLDTRAFIGPLKPLVWGDKTIEYRSFSVRVCLGLAIDERLSWANHVESVSTSYSSKVKMLRRISFLPKATLETIYYKTVIPRVLWYVRVGLLLRLFDERSRTNPPQSSKTYPQTTKRHGRRNSTHKCKLDAIKIFLLLSYSKYNL